MPLKPPVRVGVLRTLWNVLLACFITAALLLSPIFLWWTAWWSIPNPFDRSREFRAQIRAGQPLVQAIKQFRKDIGRYPKSLPELAPRYLPEVASAPNDLRHKFNRWGYWLDTNDGVVSYHLFYYMGKADVEYDPPNWTANDDGHEMILSK